MEKKATFIVFGGTGDLTKRKLLPAFAGLVKEGLLYKGSTIIGVGRSEYTNETYREMVLDSIKEEQKKELSNLNIKYYQADSSVEGSLDGLKKKIEEFEDSQKPIDQERIYYLATTYKIFPDILNNLKKAKLNEHTNSKIVFEKPFGHDLKSAQMLEENVHNIFPEDKVYRIDHYLGKDSIQNITVFRFANPLIDDILNSKYVESIQIYSNEDMGVGNRLGYYDGAGAVKDMVQSHLLQVASLILMERPNSMLPGDIHDKKFEALKNLQVLPAQEHILGQYEGYEDELKESNLSSSNTETFARLKLASHTPRWKGTDIFLETGKNLKRKEARVIINFKPILENSSGSFKGIKKNKLIIGIQPSQEILLKLNMKDPKSSQEVSSREMSLNEGSQGNHSDGYKRLIKDILSNDSTLFIRHDELKESWRIIEDFEKLRPEIPLQRYKKGIETL